MPLSVVNNENTVISGLLSPDWGIMARGGANNGNWIHNQTFSRVQHAESITYMVFFWHKKGAFKTGRPGARLHYFLIKLTYK